MRTVASLDELAELVGSEKNLYLRWSKGPESDSTRRSRDELTGVELPGLSASALAVEPWWNGRPMRLWVARRLYDYRHLEERRPDAKPWVLEGAECGRGPDNEPLVDCRRPVAWIAPEAVDEAARLIDEQRGDWGPLDRVDEAAPSRS
ncbi:MAG TPA: DUF6098 family protein [Acidimicrobiales bacterium]|nr:DUF6098 family protein [Acidimicrobiales bacterium]